MGAGHIKRFRRSSVVHGQDRDELRLDPQAAAVRLVEKFSDVTARFLKVTLHPFNRLRFIPLLYSFQDPSMFPATNGAILVLTIVWHDWIEVINVAPDHPCGSLEWATVLVLLLGPTASAVARREWRATPVLQV